MGALMYDLDLSYSVARALVIKRRLDPGRIISINDNASSKEQTLIELKDYILNAPH